MGDVGGFGRPGRDGAGARADDLGEAGEALGSAARAVGEDFFEDGVLGIGERRGGVGELDQVDEIGGGGADGEAGGGEVGEKLLEAGRGKGRRAAERQHGREIQGWKNSQVGVRGQ